MFPENPAENLDGRFVARLRSFADEPLTTFDPVRTAGAVTVAPRRRWPALRLALSAVLVAAVVVAAAIATAQPETAPGTGSGGTQAVAPDSSFPADYAATSGWLPIGLATSEDWQFGTFDEAVAALRTFFAAGVRPVSEAAVTITVPTMTSATKDVRVFVQILGGVNANQAGEVFRVWMHRTQAGWQIDHSAEATIFCRVPLTRPSPLHSDMAAGGLCL